jgi:hypothetical protein
MGLQIRDERQMKALTGLSQAKFDSLLPVFSDIYRATQQHTYEEGVQSGTRKRRPGGGSKGKLPTIVGPNLAKGQILANVHIVTPHRSCCLVRS